MSSIEEDFLLADDLKIRRILNGMWQVSGTHGNIDRSLAIQSMLMYHQAGFTTWDLADIYGPAEDFVSEFRKKLSVQFGQSELDKVVALTKWVPNPGPMSKSLVEHYVSVSLQRMGVEQIDLLQFHWWDYNDSNYLKALGHLMDLKDEGMIKHLALTNFDTKRMEEILDNGIKIVSNQVQYSLVDTRPQIAMAAFCNKNNISLLTYGTLCGGLMSEKYVGAQEPMTQGELNTASLQKYKNMIDAWGDWKLFQELLAILDNIAKKHNVSIANITTRYILDKQSVAGVIIGVRLGISEHISDNNHVFGLKLDSEDNEKIESVISKSENLYELIGDCGDEYRH